MAWDTNAVNNWLLVRAEDAERNLHQTERDRKGRPAFDLDFDSDLATFYLYNGMVNKACLASLDRVLAELDRLEREPEVAPEAKDRERYMRQYRHTLGLLRKTFQEW